MITNIDNMSDVDFRKIIADELTRRQMTQAELAHRAKMTTARVSDFLNGKLGVTSSTLGRMFKVLGLTVTRAKPVRKPRVRT